MTGDEKKLLELFRACDNRGRRLLLVIAEAEAKHAARGLCAAYNKTLRGNAYNLPEEEEKAENEGG